MLVIKHKKLPRIKLCRSSVGGDMTMVSTLWGRGLICKVGVEETCQADPLLEEFRAVWARDGGRCRCLGDIFPCLGCSAGFRYLGALVDCGSPSKSVLCLSFPRVMVDGKCLEGGLSTVMETLLWGTARALSFL